MTPAVTRPILAVFAVAATVWCQGLSPVETKLSESVSANNLKGHVAFLASDALEGRATPSPGLEVAAEYLSSQFLRFGLQPLSDGTYFQKAPYIVSTQPMDSFELKLEGNGKTLTLGKEKATVTTLAAVTASGLDVVHVSLPEAETPLPEHAAIAGKAVLLNAGPIRTRAMFDKRQALLALGAKVVITSGMPMGSGQRLRAEDAAAAPSVSPIVTTSDAEWGELIKSTADGAMAFKLSASIPAPVEKKVTLKNVIGVLPGSDATLKDTTVILSAHYDHVGVNPRLEGDKIFNGANDDASGVATVLELARAFTSQPERPKRTLVFALWFGEELGLVGARYYAKHPVFPLDKTVANLNFEHMGRTDDSEGPKLAKLTASGFDFTDMDDVLKQAGADTGVEAWQHESNSTAFFARADNLAFAEAGVPALTICVAWLFPDYHREGDHWDKIDYDNMAKVTNTLAVFSWRLGNAPQGPRWRESNASTARYVEAWKKLTGVQGHAGAQ